MYIATADPFGIAHGCNAPSSFVIARMTVEPRMKNAKITSVRQAVKADTAKAESSEVVSIGEYGERCEGGRGFQENGDIARPETMV